MEYPIDKLINFCLVTDKMNEDWYKKIGQTKSMRRLEQNFAGKVGELFVNNWLGFGQEEYIMTILTKQQVMGAEKGRPDIIAKGRGWAIKTQDEKSIERWTKNRYMFYGTEGFKSDIYCGVLVKFEYDLQSLLNMAVKGCSDDYPDTHRFADWAKSITKIKAEWGFCCKREGIADVFEIGDTKHVGFKEGIWTNAAPGLKSKTVLLAENIPFKDRLDLCESFPKVSRYVENTTSKSEEKI